MDPSEASCPSSPPAPGNTTPGRRLLVSLATYKERDNLEPLVREIQTYLPAADLLVIDDNSPDGTGELADRLAETDGRIHVLHRAGKLGLGSAILTAMRWALERDYDFLVNMDADFSHHPRYLPALVAGMDRHDVMIGSRYVPGGGTLNWPLSRRLMSWGINVVTRLLMRVPAHDTSGAYRCYSVPLLRRTALHKMVSRGYSFQEEMLYRCRVAGARMGETPIIFEDRRAGSSKVNLAEAVRSLTLIVGIGICALFGIGPEDGSG